MPSFPSAQKTIKVNELKIGHYVHLPGSWHTHPFLLSHFKIKSQDQIEKIMSMGYASVTYDPERSDAELQRSLPEPTLAGGSVAPTDAAPPSRGSGRQSFREYKETLQHAYETYATMARDAKTIFGHISGGHDEGVSLAHVMTSHLAELLLKDAKASVMASLINSMGEDLKGSHHALNVCTLSMMVGMEMGLGEEELTLLGMGALLHDLGDQRIPAQVLLKTTPLSSSERALFQLHPQYGADIAGQVPSFPPGALAAIAQHHEHLDGTGYPAGLKSDAISRFATIVAVVEAFDALSNPESPQFVSPADALSRLYRKQGTWYDGAAVVALIQTITVYPPGTLVQLTNGAIALVITVNRQHRLRPVVTLYDQSMSSSDPTIIDLAQSSDTAIARSLRLDQVSADIQTYLDPRRVTGYFVCALPDAGV